MAYTAMIVSRGKIELDSRFAWASTLASADISNMPCLIYRDSDENLQTVLFTLAQMYKMYPDKKFIYVNNEPTPLLTTFFWGINGAVCNSDTVLSSTDFVGMLISDYNQSDLCVRQPVDEFSELSRAMKRILDDNLDSEELYAIITSPNWIEQVHASMDAISTSLVEVKKVNAELVEYSGQAREAFQAIKTENAQIKEDLAQSDEALQKLSDRDKNTINKFACIRLPHHIKNVLYVCELSHCMFLTTFFLAFRGWLEHYTGSKSRLLVVEPKSATIPDRYKDNGVFFYLRQDSLGHNIGNRSAFVTDDPRKNVIDEFFSDADCPLYIVIDKAQNGILLSGSKMKTLYASGRSSLVTEKNIDPAKVIRCYSGPKESYVIPFIQNYATSTDSTRQSAYYNACEESKKTSNERLFSRLARFLGIET